MERVAKSAATQKCAAKGGVLTHLQMTTIVAAATTPATKEAHVFMGCAAMLIRLQGF